jgi:hypothetical protein
MEGIANYEIFQESRWYEFLRVRGENLLLFLFDGMLMLYHEHLSPLVLTLFQHHPKYLNHLQ